MADGHDFAKASARYAEAITVDDLAAVQVRERHLCGRHEVEVPVAGDFEQVRFELRQVARAGERRRVHEERGLDFTVAVLARVQVEHEVDERP